MRLCRGCGAMNPAGQKSCGDCGKLLAPENESQGNLKPTCPVEAGAEIAGAAHPEHTPSPNRGVLDHLMDHPLRWGFGLLFLLTAIYGLVFGPSTGPPSQRRFANIPQDRRDTLVSEIQRKSGVSQACAEQLFERVMDPANDSKRVNELGLSSDCTREVGRAYSSKKISDLASAIGTTPENVRKPAETDPRSVQREADEIRRSGESGDYFDNLVKSQSEKSMRDCVAMLGIGGCEKPETLEFYRARLVLFLVNGEKVWLNPSDDGFRTAHPFNGDHIAKRDRILADLGSNLPTGVPDEDGFPPTSRWYKRDLKKCREIGRDDKGPCPE